ncbi:cytochrome P450 [Streptomyces kaniharaensis]|uniref:Cytochrome P450 n=1 Tax=Streptomyces kaniharaensis TaxID=212423 RepID=A0A6N7KYC5_9ACTN|nr:cytochrome P450 [Streptomyces kaniharaensis]MQS15549.1 cytochrome P450 [Streptomyces kaniharaensis]
MAATSSVPRPGPPGPRGLPLLGSALDFRRDPLRTFVAAWRDHGDLVRFRGPVPVILVTHPDHLKHILADNFANYPHPDDFNRKVSVSVGEGLVTSEGEEWQRQRRTVAPSFRRESLERFAGVMADSAGRMLDRWEATHRRGASLDARVEMQSLTLEILARCLFRADWSADALALGDAVRIQLEHINAKLISVADLPERVPTRRNREFLAARRVLDETVYRLIAERRRHPDQGADADLLSMLMHTADPETGQLMTDRQLRDQVMTLFIAGHETVAATLSWICYLLSAQPAATQRARQEVFQVLGDRPPTMADLPQLKYLKLFVQEALRLYPPLWQVARMPLRDDRLGGYHIPAGSFLLLNTYITHRNPEFWDNPEGFDPERFTRERSAGRPRYAYVPYVGGPRNCVGLAFANMELTIVLASLLQRYHLNLVPGHPIVMQPDISLRARYGIRMTLREVTAEERSTAGEPAPVVVPADEPAPGAGCPVAHGRAEPQQAPVCPYRPAAD